MQWRKQIMCLQIKVVGNWMSKIEGLIRRIVRLRQVAPEEKSLVFSQYPDALKLVGKALNVNNISWVELKGGSKVTFCSHISNNRDTLQFICFGQVICLLRVHAVMPCIEWGWYHGWAVSDCCKADSTRSQGLESLRHSQ